MNDKYQLLTPSELERIKAIGFPGAMAFREVLQWIMGVLQLEVEANQVTTIEAVDLRKECTQFRGAAGMMLATSDMPIPFIYVSFVLTICMLYPLFFSASVALAFNINTNIYYIHEIVAAVIVALNCMFYVSLADVSGKFTDPFGGDIEDLDVLTLVKNTLLGTACVLRSTPLPPLNADAEMRMDASRDWGALRPAFKSMPVSSGHFKVVGAMTATSRRMSSFSDRAGPHMTSQLPLPPGAYPGEEMPMQQMWPPEQAPYGAPQGSPYPGPSFPGPPERMASNAMFEMQPSFQRRF